MVGQTPNNRPSSLPAHDDARSAGGEGTVTPRPNLGARRDAGPAFVRTLDLRGSQLSAHALTAVLDALLRHTDDEGTCWPQIARLQKHSNVPERTIRRALDFLEADGIVVRSRLHRGNGHLAGYLFRIDLARLIAADIAEQLEELERKPAGRRPAPAPVEKPPTSPPRPRVAADRLSPAEEADDPRSDPAPTPALPAMAAASPPATMAEQEEIIFEETDLSLSSASTLTGSTAPVEGKDRSVRSENRALLELVLERLTVPRAELMAPTQAGGLYALRRSGRGAPRLEPP